MNINLPDDPQFNKYYQKHLKCLKLQGLRPKTIEAYARGIRRIGNYFERTFPTPITTYMSFFCQRFHRANLLLTNSVLPDTFSGHQ